MRFVPKSNANLIFHDDFTFGHLQRTMAFAAQSRWNLYVIFSLSTHAIRFVWIQLNHRAPFACRFGYSNQCPFRPLRLGFYICESNGTINFLRTNSRYNCYAAILAGQNGLNLNKKEAIQGPMMLLKYAHRQLNEENKVWMAKRYSIFHSILWNNFCSLMSYLSVLLSSSHKFTSFTFYVLLLIVTSQLFSHNILFSVLSFGIFTYSFYLQTVIHTTSKLLTITDCHLQS